MLWLREQTQQYTVIREFNCQKAQLGSFASRLNSEDNPAQQQILTDLAEPTN